MTVVLEEREGAGRMGVVVCGCRRCDLRQAAERACERRFGSGGWHLCEERLRPSMVSLGGRVRLWEGRFEVERSA